MTVVPFARSSSVDIARISSSFPRPVDLFTVKVNKTVFSINKSPRIILNFFLPHVIIKLLSVVDCVVKSRFRFEFPSDFVCCLPIFKSLFHITLVSCVDSCISFFFFSSSFFRLQFFRQQFSAENIPI